MYYLKVKYEIFFNGKHYKINDIIESDNIVEIDALTRKGCIFVNEIAKYIPVEKIEEENQIIEEEILQKPKTKKKKVRKDVTIQDLEQTEIQE